MKKDKSNIQNIEPIKTIKVFGTLSNKTYSGTDYFTTTYNGNEVRCQNRIVAIEVLYDLTLDIPAHLIKIFDLIKLSDFYKLEIDFNCSQENNIYNTISFKSGSITYNSSSYRIELYNRDKQTWNDNTITEIDVYNLRQAIESMVSDEDRCLLL